tara:strand:+ start:200 stop:388 length:189 start_codon:yes stop_codon:yes gene_type:complete
VENGAGDVLKKRAIADEPWRWSESPGRVFAAVISGAAHNHCAKKRLCNKMLRKLAAILAAYG